MNWHRPNRHYIERSCGRPGCIQGSTCGDRSCGRYTLTRWPDGDGWRYTAWRRAPINRATGRVNGVSEMLHHGTKEACLETVERAAATQNAQAAP